MNKAQLIETVQKELGPEATKKQAAEALNAVLGAIQNGVIADEKVQIIGFGTFALKKRAARTVRNPKTGAPVAVPATSVVSFKASSGLL